MSAIQIDLGSISIPKDHHVYKCFPGRSYRYYEAVVESFGVFLDVHNLAELGNSPLDWDLNKLAELVRESRIREDERLTKRKPDRKQRTEKANRQLDSRNFNMAVGLYQSARAGDLVVVPAEGYEKDVYVGEILDEPLREVVIPQEEDRLEQRFVARPVKWLAKGPKRSFQSNLINLLHTPKAFFDIGRSSYENIYRFAYKNYFYDEHSFSTFDTSKQKFRNADNLTCSLWFEYLIAAGVARLGDESEKFTLLSILDATSKEWEHSLGEEMFININSPGSMGLRARNLFPAVALGLWALSGLAADAAFDDQGNAKEIEVEIDKLTNNSPECDLAVSKEIKDYLTTIGFEKWQEVCVIRKRMEEAAEMTAKSQLK